MKAFITITDIEDGSVTVEGALENPAEAHLSAAAIYWAYLTQNSEKLIQEASVWFAEKVKTARDEGEPDERT